MSEEGGDDSPSRPKRKIKKVVIVSSSSDSESDVSVGVAGSRRKRLRVISDGESSDSSGSSVVCSGTRRRKTLPKLRDSEAESDSSGWATDRSDSAKAATSAAKPASGFASDSSEGNSDKCSICLLRFKDQEIGTPENCEHIFCLDCITEWSKNVNTCPVDRMSFSSIIVRACMGGRVVRTEQVNIAERRSSIDELITDHSETVCEVCGSMEDEETLLLCDGCDHGYHIRCLTPPLSQIPESQWLCPNCREALNSDSDLMDTIPLSEVEDLIDDLYHEDFQSLAPRRTPLRLSRLVYRTSSRLADRDQPSTSSGHSSNSINLEAPTTSRGRGGRSSQRAAAPSAVRRRTTTKRRKYKRRRTKTVIIEYEVKGNGKFPITKKVKRKIKRRRVKKRQPRTAARRSHVRASVRAKLESLRADGRLELSETSNASAGVLQLSVHRRRAGIPALRVFGNPNELDYFSEEDNAISEEATTAVATRPTSSILSAYRQARRKMVTLPSPVHASSAPDILSNILERQTLLHSKKSIISVSVDGNVDYKLQTVNKQKKNTLECKTQEKIDLSKANESVKNVPSYPGQNRGSGGGGWGGGYRGSYQRDQNTNNFNNRSGNYDNNNYGGGYQNRQGNNYNNNYQNNNMRRDDTEYYDNFPRRPQQYSHNDDSYFDRSRRPIDNRGNNYPNHQRPNDQNQGRFSLGQSWSPYGGGTPAQAPRHDIPPTQARHSFGGFENPVDMRMGQMPPVNERAGGEMFPIDRIEAPHQDKAQSQSYQSLPEPPQAYQPLSQPPVFNFQKLDLDKSEDEKSDSGLIIDTEKYDPTEPTNDDDSGEDETVSVPMVHHEPSDPPTPPTPPAPPTPPPPPAVQSILAGIDTSAMNVPPNVLDTAVRQVLKEHRNLISSPSIETHNYRSDEDSDGDCPNFSIYSATSVHIANNTSTLTEDIQAEPLQDNLEDLVQEDDETPPSTSPLVPDIVNIETKSEISKTPAKLHYSNYESSERKKTEEEYKEKVSKRCPITANTRNPIKIKLNTPSLIKRQVSLYDEEENSQETEVDDKIERTPDVHEEKTNCNTASPRGKAEEESGNAPDLCESKVDLTVDNAKYTTKSLSPSKQNIDNQTDSLELKDKFSSDTFQIVEVNNDAKEDNEKCNDKDKNIEENIEDNSTDAIDDATDNNEDSNDEGDTEEEPEMEVAIETNSPTKDAESTRVDDNVEKMTESISETEDERSYTPCLDENKSNKDASVEMEKDNGLEGLDTEMISEEEGNEMFSENERPPSEASRLSPPRQPAGSEEGEISEKKKESKKPGRDETKKKKKKDSKKEGKDKSKSKKKSEISFKKLSKSGKERNYRERDKEEKKGERERRDSGDNESRNRRRKEKRKDLERYDVRTVVTEKRRKQKDPFGRDISPRGHSPSLSPPPRSPSLARRSSPSLPRRRSPSLRRSLSRLRRTPSRGRRSISRSRRSVSRARRSLSRVHRSISRPHRSQSRLRRSPSRNRRSISRGRRSISRVRRSPSRLSPSRNRRSPLRKSIPARITPVRGRSPSRPRGSPIRARRSPLRRSGTPRVSPRRRSPARRKRRRSNSRVARRRSASGSPPRRTVKKKKRTRSARRALGSSVDRKRRRSLSRHLEPEPSPPSPVPSLRPPSPRTPPPDPASIPAEDERRERRRRDPERPRRRVRDLAGPSKEVFTSGDNILVSVSFKDQERGEEGERRRRRESRRDRRRRRRAAVATEAEAVKPVAIIDLDRSPFRELTPSPKNVIVLSDSDHGEKEGSEAITAPIAAEPQPEPAPPALGPKTPPEPVTVEVAEEPGERTAEPEVGPGSETHSPDAYDPFEPTRSPSASPASASPAPAAPPSPPRALITLEAAQRSNMSADEVLDRRPLTPVEKVLALLQSTREVSPEGVGGEVEAPPAPAPRIVLPSPTRSLPKLFPGKPSPIKSNPVKPMQALRLPRLPAVPSDGGASPYSPGSSDFGELFEPPPRRSRAAAKVPVRLDRKRASKTHVGVKVDEDNLKILDDLPSSAVEMQVKSKFLKKLNRQERVVEEVKLVLKPHYNKKRVTKDEYKDILRRAVPKICHNKSGEINPTKIQALVEAYVKKFRKKHKLGVA